MRTLQPPQGSSTQAKIANAQHNMVNKSSKGRLSSKLPPGQGSVMGQNRSSTSTTIENQSSSSYYTNGRAGTNLIGQ